MGSEVLTHTGHKLFLIEDKPKSNLPTVVFVHHMGGSHRTLRRHQRLLASWGYRTVAFDLFLASKYRKLPLHPLTLQLSKGVFNLWKEQIQEVLDSIPGDKVLFCFSGPSLSGIWAASSRSDISKVVVDGGPFHEIFQNTRNYFRREVGVKQPSLNALTTGVAMVLWGRKPLKNLHLALAKWPQHVPILSIRGTLDPIVSLRSIEAVFIPHPEIKLTVLDVPGGKHLDGLKNHSKIYSEALWNFLN